MTAQAGDGMPGFGDRDLPLAAGSLTGVRLWHVDVSSFERVWAGPPAEVEGLLTGIFGGMWQRGENVAVCGGGRWPPAGHADRVPAHRCGCGFWAYWTLRDALHSDYRQAEVVGIMEGYGRARIGTRGCRCSRARILALHVPHVTPDFLARGHQPHNVAETLGRYYGVPWYTSLAEMLAAHPPTADYLPRRRQHLAATSLPPAASPAAVKWPRVVAFAVAYAVLAGTLITLATLWSPWALAVVTAIMLAGAFWPIGMRWLPRWVRKLMRERGTGAPGLEAGGTGPRGQYRVLGDVRPAVPSWEAGGSRSGGGGSRTWS